MFRRIALIGASATSEAIASAARRAGVANQVVASSWVGQIDFLLVDEYCDDPAKAIVGADLIIVTDTTEALCGQLQEVLMAAEPGTIVTDAGPSKRTIFAAVEKVKTRATFVGSHPLGLRLRAEGASEGEDPVAESSIYITLNNQTDLAAAARIARFWECLGARTVFLHPSRHDELIAMLSHLPRLFAAAQMELLHRSGEDTNLLKFLWSFVLQDATRPVMNQPADWVGICHENPDEVCNGLRRAADILTEFAAMIESGEQQALRDKLTALADIRKRLE